jgi:hypothetical protein
MDISNLDLEGQTAPESTRGLFDPLPEVNRYTNLQAALLIHSHRAQA